MPLSRRNFIRQTGAGLISLPLAAARLGASELLAAPKGNPAPSSRLLAANRFPEMMQDWLVETVRTTEAKADAERARLQNRSDAEEYVASVRKRIAECFRALPTRTPLNARVTGTIVESEFTIEKIIFESRPDFLVTGNLYLPKRRSARLPAILGLCGHWKDSKADAENYQTFAQGLVLQGYVCLLIDPIGQGERRQYLDESLQSSLSFGVPEHLQMGNQQTLIGDFLGSWFVWDAIRALDYLETRDEVDSKRLGATGCSGGATVVSWLCALDPRLMMIAPACFVTTMRRNAENELPADPEQCPPRALALGLDHSDFIAAFAPRPAIIIAQEHDDIFDVRGSITSYQRLKHLYELLGHPDNIEFYIGPDHHGFSRPCREAMYRWFNRYAGFASLASEPVITPLPASALWCTPRGTVADLRSKTVMAFTAETARRLSSTREALRGESLAKVLRRELKLSSVVPAVADYRILRTMGPREYPLSDYCTYAVETEPGICVLLTRLYSELHNSRIGSQKGPAIVYVSHHSCDNELRDEELVRELIAQNPSTAFYACDLRGIGESQPNSCGSDQFFKPYGSHYFYASYGQLLDRPLVGQRTYDLQRVVQLLSSLGHSQIHLAGCGWGALPVTFVACLSKEVTQVTLKHGLRSYQDLAETAQYRWPCALLLTGVLQAFDLPDCYTELASKQLVQIAPWGPNDGMG